jgi:hypothetical protein
MAASYESTRRHSDVFGLSTEALERNSHTRGRGFAMAGNLRLEKVGAGNGIRTRDFDLGKVALYH